ncbi:NnrU family protein [Henriciella barbarensis]|uniref:NnrU family protein n=1 Tax=Henriciella barbarensis TaxID=86342 RepID=A0A399QYG4_9PROT|nr:NnrU family protein [Henriciella barbarensis]RIJ22359.1 NnrU family protein [Henriciella barbarensis]
MVYLLAGLALFFGAHIYSALRTRAPERRIEARIGAGPFKGLYTLVAIAGLVLIVWGYGAMRPAAIIWQPPVWTVHLNILIQLIAMPILIAANLPPGYIKKTLKHPMLVAVKVWAIGHLLANGELNSILLFGSFLAYAVFDRIMVKKRGETGLPAEVRVSVMSDVIAVLIGLIIWGAMIFGLHEILFGQPVIAGLG